MSEQANPRSDEQTKGSDASRLGASYSPASVAKELPESVSTLKIRIPSVFIYYTGPAVDVLH